MASHRFQNIHTAGNIGLAIVQRTLYRGAYACSCSQMNHLIDAVVRKNLIQCGNIRQIGLIKLKFAISAAILQIRFFYAPGIKIVKIINADYLLIPP